MEGVQVILNKEFLQAEVQKLIRAEMVWWHMDDLRAKTGKSQNWLKDNILYQPRFRKELETFAHFPEAQGDKWCFIADKMEQFLKLHFRDIFVQEESKIRRFG